MNKERIPRIDNNEEVKELLLHCRLKYGDIWEDSICGHKVGCLDATNENDIMRLMGNNKATLAIQDPPYNVIVGNSNTSSLGKASLEDYIEWSKQWVQNTVRILKSDAHFYIWLGADQKEGFQPLPNFMLMMREFEELKARSFITMRNQRGYGTQKNWMAVRQELLYYVKGSPDFETQYTEIPKILRVYYKEVNGEVKENLERSKSNTIRPGNVWVDVQQVFYRMEENVPGCYAQKPLKAIERIILSSSKKGDLIVDFLAHSGTTLLAAEKLKRKCLTMDIDPIFAEITIRRLERLRRAGKVGWQFMSPFPEAKVKLEIGNNEKTKPKESLQGTLFGILDNAKNKEPIWKS